MMFYVNCAIACSILGTILACGGLGMILIGNFNFDEHVSTSDRALQVLGPFFIIIGFMFVIACIVLCILGKKKMIDQRNQNAMSAGGISGPYITGMAPPVPARNTQPMVGYPPGGQAHLMQLIIPPGHPTASAPVIQEPPPSYHSIKH